MPTPLSPEDIYDLQRLGDVVLSPDGTRVAFVVIESDPDQNQKRHSLFVVPTDGNRDPHRLTRLADASIPRWSPDGDQLAFTSSRERDIELTVGKEKDDQSDKTDTEVNDGGDEKPEPQVWVFDLARGGDPRQITDFDEGVREYDWGPNSERLVVAARVPTEDQQEYLNGVREENAPYEVTRTKHKVDGEGYTDDVRTYLSVVDVDSRETTRLDDAYGRGAQKAFSRIHPAWEPGKRIAFRSYRGPHPDETYIQDAYTIAPDGSELRQLTDSDLTVADLRWSPDGRKLSFSGSDPENVHKPTEVFVADPDAGGYYSVSASLDRTVSWIGCAEWITQEALLAPIGDEGRTRLVRLPTDRDDPERVFGAQGTDRTVTAYDAGPEQVAVALSHPSEGVDVFAFPTAGIGDGVEPTRLSALNDDLLRDAALPRCERIWFENSDGGEVQGLVYFPAEVDPNDPELCPLICHIHGGPTAYDAPEFDFDYAYWAGKGYAVLTVNYRGSTSYGRAFSESIRGEWGSREIGDILSGVDAVVDRGWADPERLFLSGFSQGGINTLYVVTQDDRFAAAAPEHGIYDFYSLFGTCDWNQWCVNDFGLPWQNEERYRRMSSLLDIDEVDTPLLITAGENDWRCPPSQAEQLYVSAQRADIEAKLIVYQNERHNIGDPEREIHRLEALTDWFETHDSGTNTN